MREAITGASLGSAASRELGDSAHFELGFGTVGEQSRGDSSLAANPRLHRIEPCRGLMNVIQIGDIMESAQQLDQAIATVANALAARYGKICRFQSRTLAAWAELTDHRNSPDPQPV